MKIMLAVFFVVGGFVIGNLLSTRFASQSKSLDTLFACIEVLKREICVYGNGLGLAIIDGKLHEKSEFFRSVYIAITDGKSDVSGTITESSFPEEIKKALGYLFNAVFFLGEDEIEKAFDKVTEIIMQCKKKSSDASSKNGPLYRKIGLLCGIAMAILII